MNGIKRILVKRISAVFLAAAFVFATAAVPMSSVYAAGGSDPYLGSVAQETPEIIVDGREIAAGTTVVIPAAEDSISLEAKWDKFNIIDETNDSKIKSVKNKSFSLLRSGETDNEFLTAGEAKAAEKSNPLTGDKAPLCTAAALLAVSSICFAAALRKRRKM